MSKDTAFIGSDTVLGTYWTKKRYFDYLINRDNFALLFGRSFQQLVFLDPAIAKGAEYSREQIEEDTQSCDYLINRLPDIKPELTIFLTTCDMLSDQADENSAILESSDDPYVQNRINLYTALNRQFGRVLNVHIPALAMADKDFAPLLHTCVNPPKGKAKLPFAPQEMHQFYFHQMLLADVEKCIPLGISSFIASMPPLSTEEVVQALAPDLLPRLREAKEGDPVGSTRKSIHSFHWLDPKDGYLVTKEDQIELLKFHFAS